MKVTRETRGRHSIRGKGGERIGAPDLTHVQYYGGMGKALFIIL